jgi:deazaflavin-dependent oxidoreductase (nitroreductase family)
MGILDVADRTWPLLTRVMGVHTLVYRVSGGRIGHRIPVLKAPMLLLDHVGAKSGVVRTSPLLYIPIAESEGDDVFIVASKGGYPKNPAWLYNLRAHPETTVQIGRERRAVRAREASPQERERLWPKALELYPTYADYQARSKGRQIPLVVLERR